MPTRTETSKRRAVQRRAASPRRPTMVTRRKPQKSGMAKAADKLGGLLPGMGAQKSQRTAGTTSKKRTTGGLALLAGAAGFAMKNRQKITSMIRRRESSTRT
jgi:hypothetical protein